MELNKIFDKTYYCCSNCNAETINELKENGFQNIEICKYTLTNKYYEYHNPKKILFYDIIKDAHKAKYNKIIILTDDIKFIGNNKAEFYLSKYSNNDMCIINPGDIVEDCFILSKSGIDKIYKYINKVNYTILHNQIVIEKFINKNVLISRLPEIICLHKIDYVISYVDSSDKIWYNDYKKYAAHINSSYNKINRFRSFDILQYHLRGIYENINWVNNIYLIVSDSTQVPEWVSDKVHIIYHNQIIPDKYLPTFNSTTIEAFMHNIPNLSEYFIYANDDMFITNKLSKHNFYDKGKIVTSYNPTSMSTNYIQHCKNGYNIAASNFMIKKPFVVFNHTPHPFIKSTCYYIHHSLGNQIYHRISKFRDTRNFNQYIFLYHELLSDNIVKSPSSLYYTEITNKGISLSKENALKHNFLCINDNALSLSNECYEHVKTYLHKFLSNIYYKSSKYENTLIVKHTQKNDLKVALCAIAKNENLYIREWVEWYKNLGVCKIILYDNNDVDGERFEEVIADYIKSGFVKVIDNRGVEKGCVFDKQGINLQTLCYIDAYENHCKEIDWICFFDIDEFLYIKKDYKIYDILSNEIYNNAKTIVVSWEHYDDNNLLHYENKPVIKRFTHRSKIVYHGIKSIVKTGYKIQDKTLRNMIHNFRIDNDSTYYITGDKLNDVLIKYNDHWWLISPTYHNNAFIVLNHYKTKTVEEYIKRHLNRHWGTSKEISSNAKSIKDCKLDFYKYCEITPEKENIFNNPNDYIRIKR